MTILLWLFLNNILWKHKKLVHMHSRKGILNIDVVSFERLAYKVFEELGGGNRPVLDDTGKNLIVRRVLEKEKKKLDYFGSSIEKQVLFRS